MASTVKSEPGISYRIRLQVGLILLTVIALLSSRDLLRMTSHGQAGGAEAVAYIHRFDAAKKLLPPRGVICYVPDPHIEPNTTKDYFLAQYALAPLVLRTSAGCDLLIANYAGDSRHAIAPFNYLPVEDFGNGVLLFRKAR